MILGNFPKTFWDFLLRVQGLALEPDRTRLCGASTILVLEIPYLEALILLVK